MIRGGDPGPCPICGTAHTACTAAEKAITVTMLPARDRRLPSHDEALEMARASSPLAVSTKTYRRGKT